MASTIRDGWLLASAGACNGWVQVGLDAALATIEGAAAVEAGIEGLLAVLERAPERLSKDVPILLGLADGPCVADLETRRLVEVGRAFRDLVDGRIAATPDAASSMPGSDRASAAGP